MKRSRASLLGAAVVSAAALALGGDVRAAPPGDGADPTASREVPRAAVLPPLVEGELSDVDRAKLVDELVGGLRRGSFEVVAPDEVVAKESAGAKCTDAKCAKKVADATGASHVVRAKVRAGDREYSLIVELLDGDDGKVIATTSDACEICGIADAGQLMSAAAATLRTKLDALAGGPARFILDSDPPKSIVTIDGEVAGVTPLEMEVLPGKHVVRVSAEGYIAVDREVTFVEGITESQTIKLERLPTRLPGRTWGYVSLGFGIAALGGGVGLIALHDLEKKRDCSGANVDADGDCKFLYDTKWWGVGTAVSGAVLITLGAAIFATTSKRDKRNRPSKERSRDGRGKAKANVGVGPGSLVISGRF